MAEEEKKAKQDEPEKQQDEEKSRQPNKKMLVWGIIAAVIILEIPVMLVLVKVTQPKDMAKIESEKRETEEKQTKMEATSIGAITEEKPIEAIVNIAGTEGKRFLKVVMVFEFEEKEYPNLGIELERRAPKYKSLLIQLLAPLTLTELNEPDIKDRICADYLRQINETLAPEMGKVKETIMTEFLIQ